MSALQNEIAEAIREAQAPLVLHIERLIERISTLENSAPDTLLSTKEAARLMGVSEQTLRKWVKEGKVPCERRGKKMRFSKYDLVTN